MSLHEPIREAPALDPDRFFDFQNPGSQEWWYFDALSDDGLHGLVVVFYAALPFDPDYGREALAYLRNPTRKRPHPRDYCAIGISWYHQGKTAAYALNGYRRDLFRHSSSPFQVCIDGNELAREDAQYRLRIETPASIGHALVEADLTFRPVPTTVPLERNLGTKDRPHHWIVASSDCRVSGTVRVRRGGRGEIIRAVAFQGRGYHDHNAGVDEISLAMKRWHWGRVHAGADTHVYYHAIPWTGPTHSLWITLRDGAATRIIDPANVTELAPARAHPLRFPQDHGLTVEPTCLDGTKLVRYHRRAVDSGPFYTRWLSEFHIHQNGLRASDLESGSPGTLGLSELLETRNLHTSLSRFMIPFRLKKPKMLLSQ